MLKLIMAILQWAMVIGVAGGLVDATRAMRNKAVRAHQVGLISRSRLNHALVDGPRPRPKPPSVHKR